jgi:hypothetical protein
MLGKSSCRSFNLLKPQVHTCTGPVSTPYWSPSILLVTSHTIFTTFSDLLERLTIFAASLLMVSDVNIHFDDPTNADASKFANLLSFSSLQQHVASTTHRTSHMLNLFITRPELAVNALPVDPPLLSDHSLLVADVDCPQ